MAKSPDRANLYFCQGTSDKEYHVRLVPRGNGFAVDVDYGRRGSELRSGTRTPKPISRDEARKVFDALVREKLAEGYTRAAPATARPPKPRAPVSPHWRHPDLGRFTFDGDAWERTVTVPALKAFKYDRRQGTKCRLAFEADDESDLPSRAAVAVATRVLANQQTLFPRLTAALWADFTGAGPDSGMFWHDNLAEVAEAIDEWEEAAPPASPADLPKIFHPYAIVIRKHAHRYPKPVAEIDCSAAFDEEHDLSFLTDGRTVLGIGRAADVEPFKRPRRRPRPKSSRK